jgi:hypothetical protein
MPNWDMQNDGNVQDPFPTKETNGYLATVLAWQSNLYQYNMRKDASGSWAVVRGIYINQPRERSWSVAGGESLGFQYL